MFFLQFYGYYKQAKEGPCNETKPSFWDVVKKAKWYVLFGQENLRGMNAKKATSLLSLCFIFAFHAAFSGDLSQV